MTCKWDRTQADYLRDGEPCRRDDYGDPTRHCTAKRSCSHHVGPRELTCGRCVGDVRQNIHGIVQDAALMPVEAVADGVDSEAAMLAAPAADYRVFSARRTIDRQWLMANIPARNLERALGALLEDDDVWHPYSVLTRWHLMLAEDYGHALPDRMTIASSAAYLDRHLHRVAQDDEQDFPLLRRELEKCRRHLAAVLRNSTTPERGAPCPECVGSGAVDPRDVRLQREYGHWCWLEDCEKEHHATDEADRWVCPRNRAEHTWTDKAYRNYISERTTRAAR